MENYLHLFVEEANSYNDLILGNLLPKNLWKPLPLFFQSWLRNYIAIMSLYLVFGTLWSFFIYYWKRHVYFPREPIPSNETMLQQIMVSMIAMPWYSALPTLSEYMVERGWTLCFSRVNEVGWPTYLAYSMLYVVLVEFGVYWMHRELHDIKFLYKHLHASHHSYNKRTLLTPFTGLALNPLDGIIQAVPHVITIFIIPTHFMSHTLLLFGEYFWTMSIHDCIYYKVWPIMGTDYHMIHHMSNRHNYGHYTVWMDWMFGTLQDPQVDSKKPS